MMICYAKAGFECYLWLAEQSLSANQNTKNQDTIILPWNYRLRHEPDKGSFGGSGCVCVL